MAIVINIEKAKAIAHEKRKSARYAEFAPLDVMATVPSKATEAELKRQAIRDKYAVMQKAIDAAKTLEELKQAMP